MEEPGQPPRSQPSCATSGSEREVTIRIPGSSGNLGPGFDTLALALGLYCQLSFRLLAKADPTTPLVTLHGPVAQNLPADKTNLVYQTLKRLWADKPDLLERTRITINTEIPLERGLGSSAAAIAGTVWAAQALSGKKPEPSSVLACAAAIEGHPDNVAASVLGALTVAAPSLDKKSFLAQKIAWPDNWQTLVVVPPYGLSTARARAVLPGSVSFQHAVGNLQRTALLLAAVANRDEKALREALHDQLHEPYRQALVPELQKLRQEAANLPVLGCVLSGAGPSLLVIVETVHKQTALDKLKSWAERQDARIKVLDLPVNREGMKQVQE